MGATSRTNAIATAASLVALAVTIALVAFVVLGGQVSRSFGLVPETVYDTNVGWDIGCATTNAAGDPAGCSTPLPTAEPAALAAAVPLDVPALDVPISSPGPMRIDLGEATIANGVLHQATFHLDGIAPGVQILPHGLAVTGPIRLVVESTDPTRPGFENGYVHGWRHGVEVVKAYLVLDVASFDPGFVLKIRDVVVR